MRFRTTLAALVTFALVPAPTTAKDRNFHIFLCFGQSNMDGHPGLLIHAN